MFSAVTAAIRSYVIRKLAEAVATDIAENGLTEADIATIESVLAA